MTTAMPEVVILCGSSRARGAVEREQRRLTLEGRIVISPGPFEDAQRRGIAVTSPQP